VKRANLRWLALAAKRFAAWMFEELKHVFVEPKPNLPEDEIPIDKSGRPDMSFYTEPLQHYIDLYGSFLDSSGTSREQQRSAWKQRVHATWGLLAKGQEALPFLLTLVQNANPAAREDASFLLGELKSDSAISEHLLAHLGNEKDLVVLSAMIDALGKLRYRPAIPALAHMILAPEIDLDTRWNAADSLGAIAGQDFSGPDKLQKAESWIAANKG